MAHQTFSKMVSSLVSAITTRRGYASAAQSGGVTRGVAPNLLLKKGPEEAVDTAWVPDPTTGFYRPGNAGNGVDPAELRAMLLKKKTRSEQ